MKNLIVPLLLLFLGGCSSPESPATFDFQCTVTVAPRLQEAFRTNGRLLLSFSKKGDREPRFSNDAIVGITPEQWDGTSSFSFTSRRSELLSAGLGELKAAPGDTLYCQMFYKQNPDDARNNAAGNLFSPSRSLCVASGTTLDFTLDQQVEPYTIVDHPLVRTVEMKSRLLTDFFGRERMLYASALLPADYDPARKYPICYRVPGLNGVYDAPNRYVADSTFMAWWQSKEAPKVIWVFVDSRGPYGDTYQMDSDNNGPCGRAFTEELMPAVEQLTGYDPSTRRRYLMGCSTGGWVVLALQIFYPDLFDGCWSYSPDPIEFGHFGLTDIYRDDSFFENRFGYPNPARRTVYGEITGFAHEWIQEENVISPTGSYVASGGQFGAYNAVFSPRGKDGKPAPMFDPLTGKIDRTVAAHWEKYDLMKVLQQQWPVLGPKLQGKIHLWTGDMDGLYSNVATRFFARYIESTENPRSDARIDFGAMCGHCQNYNDRTILQEMISR